LPGEVEAAFIAEAEVDERHVGIELASAVDRFGVGGGDADDADPLAVQHGPGDLEEAVVVIDDQAPDSHASSLPAGLLRCATYPPHIADPTEASPYGPVQRRERNTTFPYGSRGRGCTGTAVQ
jgi:hypothetical protein